MKTRLAVILSILLVIILVGLVCKTQAAEQYPVKPITFIVPLDAGSDADIVARPLVQKASAVLGKPIVVVNKPGGGGTIGYRELCAAKPDGYTIGMGTITIVTAKMQGLLPLDHHDFMHIATFYTMPANIYGSVKAKQSFKTIQEVISFAKSHPGEVSMATPGIGSNLWVGAMVFISGTGIKLNVIPQAGGTGVVTTQVAGGHVDLAISHLAAAKPQMDAGNVRLLAVMGDERAPGYENVPTLKDIGYNIGWESSGMVMGPLKMPHGIMDKLTHAFEKAANDPVYKKFLLDRFGTPFYLSSDKIIPYLDGRRAAVREIMEKAGILKEN